MKNLLLLVLLCCLSTSLVQAQEASTNSRISRWYMGMDGRVSLGSSTFKSFGVDKTRVGGGLGLLGGYHINSFLSAEAELSYRHLGLSAYDCCQGLWFGTDGNRYFAPVAGMENWKYSNLRSSVNLYGLGARLNVDFIALLRPQSRWSALISPSIYIMGSKAVIQTVSSDEQVDSGSSFHFGVGGDLGVGYQICSRMNIRLYSGITYLTSKGMDGLPQMEHKCNYTWDSGVKFILNLK